jgi:hypothetical protein
VLAGAAAVVRLVGALHRGPHLPHGRPEDGRARDGRAGQGWDGVVPVIAAAGRCRMVRRCPGLPCDGQRYRPTGPLGKASSGRGAARDRHRAGTGCEVRRRGVRFARPPPEGRGRARSTPSPSVPTSSRRPSTGLAEGPLQQSSQGLRRPCRVALRREQHVPDPQSGLRGSRTRARARP